MIMNNGEEVHITILKGEFKMNNKLRQPISLSITVEEANILQKLNDKGISNISVFRRGLKVFCEDTIDTLTQNNNS